MAVSFDTPEYTANSDALGTLRILEAVRMLGLTDKTRIYQASTSELYGLVQEIPQGNQRLSIPAVLCSGQVVRLLDHGEPSRVIWDVRCGSAV